MKTDASSNPYIDVRGVRLTYVKVENRAHEKNWPGCDVLRINAYKEDPAVSQSLMPGPEIPLGNEGEEFGKLIIGLHHLFAEVRSGNA